MEVGVLGPLVAQAGGVCVVPSAAKPRQILALLALHPGRVVTISDLMDELWGDDMPRSAAAVIQTYVRQLRGGLSRALGEDDPGAKAVLVTRPRGYALDIEPCRVDVFEFEGLMGAGRAAWVTGDRAAASARFTDALALWRGPALVDVAAGRQLEGELLRLNELRLGALEARIAADLDLGRYAEVLAELASLTALHPTYENLHAMYMLALHRAGRTADALMVFRRLRGVLVEQLGVEPAPQVQQLHRSILAADPELRRTSGVDGGLLGRLVG